MGSLDAECLENSRHCFCMIFHAIGEIRRAGRLAVPWQVDCQERQAVERLSVECLVERLLAAPKPVDEDTPFGTRAP